MVQMWANFKHDPYLDCHIWPDLGVHIWAIYVLSVRVAPPGFVSRSGPGLHCRQIQCVLSVRFGVDFTANIEIKGQYVKGNLKTTVPLRKVHIWPRYGRPDLARYDSPDMDHV